MLLYRPPGAGLEVNVAGRDEREDLVGCEGLVEVGEDQILELRRWGDGPAHRPQEELAVWVSRWRRLMRSAFGKSSTSIREPIVERQLPLGDELQRELRRTSW